MYVSAVAGILIIIEPSPCSCFYSIYSELNVSEEKQSF